MATEKNFDTISCSKEKNNNKEKPVYLEFMFNGTLRAIVGIVSKDLGETYQELCSS